MPRLRPGLAGYPDEAAVVLTRDGASIAPMPVDRIADAREALADLTELLDLLPADHPDALRLAARRVELHLELAAIGGAA